MACNQGQTTSCQNTSGSGYVLVLYLTCYNIRWITNLLIKKEEIVSSFSFNYLKYS